MSANRPEPGTPMIMQWRKWDGSPHWRNDGVYLGADEWGDWVGQPAGWRSTRPAADFVAEVPNVTLVPHTRSDFTLTVHRHHPRLLRVYIDLAWDVRWVDDRLITGIDMDLDVVRRLDERGTYVDDRDEWAEHSIRFGYPLEVMIHLEAVALELAEEVSAERAPFDSVGDRWIDVLAGFGLDRD